MKLLYQTHSPYARKVLVAAYELGLQESLTVVHHETSPTRRNEGVFALNPLGKVPVLICDDGTVLFDSNVICEYLDGLHEGTPLIPSQPAPRYHALKMQALAQGIADAGIAARWESERRPAELRWPSMHDGQVEKVATACDYLERELGDAQHPHIGDIALVTALSWVEFRRVYDFARGRPRLARWYAALCARPSMLATRLEGQTQD
ncbi:MAG: glutathione S-transferase family protein [Proteobacteria bacterium]|nr:glutathione S-transferase family protein [Pseudomonadota bacterium]